MKIYRLLAIFCLLLVSSRVLPLVNPEEIDSELEGWMVTFYVENEENDFLFPICQGALIDPEWVLSTGYCFIDIFDFVNPLLNQDGFRIVAYVGELSRLFVVEKQYEDAESGLYLFKLDEAPNVETLRVEPLNLNESPGKEVMILGYEISESIKDESGNPDGELDVSCSIGNGMFFNDYGICYVISFPRSANNLLVARGTLIDPGSADAPEGFYNSLVKDSGDGSRLFIDFSTSGSYPCIEDIGSPVVTSQEDGSYALVGVATYIGPAGGMSTCNPSLLNGFVNIANYQDILQKAKADFAFGAVCPASPLLALEQQEGNLITLQWSAVENADGYRLVYSEALGYQALVEIDVGNTIDYQQTLSPGLEYSFTLQAYNNKCTSGLSMPVNISTLD